MLKNFVDLKDARILVSNDDGINSEGIKKLEIIAKGLSNDVWVVAPQNEQSGTGHSLTLRSPLRIKKLAKKRFSVNGTPTDCVLLAINKIMVDNPPDIVLAGINHGSNVAEDLTYSGTIAVAIEATLSKIPAIALSQGFNKLNTAGEIDWSASEIYAAEAIKKVISIAWPKDILININFPPVPSRLIKGFEVTRVGHRKIGDEIIESNDPNGKPCFWIGAQKHSNKNSRGTDVDAIQNGLISMCPLSINFTSQAMVQKLKMALK